MGNQNLPTDNYKPTVRARCWAGFTAKLESFDNTRGFNVKYYLLPKRKTP